jgi:hypothetical protein
VGDDHGQELLVEAEQGNVRLDVLDVVAGSVAQKGHHVPPGELGPGVRLCWQAQCGLLVQELDER